MLLNRNMFDREEIAPQLSDDMEGQLWKEDKCTAKSECDVLTAERGLVANHKILTLPRGVS